MIEYCEQKKKKMDIKWLQISLNIPNIQNPKRYINTDVPEFQ
jgi:hypothetical protein